MNISNIPTIKTRISTRIQNPVHEEHQCDLINLNGEKFGSTKLKAPIYRVLFFLKFFIFNQVSLIPTLVKSLNRNLVYLYGRKGNSPWDQILFTKPM